MLAKPNRLKNRVEIASVARARGFKDDFLTLKMQKNNSPDSRFAFVISSKSLKKATARNLVKRRAREIIRKNLSNIEHGYDILFIFSSNAAKLDYLELEKELITAMRAQKIFT